MNATGMRRSLRELPWWVIDVLVAVAVAAIVAYAPLWLRLEAGARPPDALAYGLGLAAAGVLLARRRWPVAVLLLTIGISYLFYGLGYAGGTLQPAVVVALYSAAAAGRRWSSLAVLGWFVVTSVPFRVGVEGENPFGRGVVFDVGFMVASWALGVAAYHRRRWTAEVRERLRRAEADRELEAQRRVGEERLRIARELHDVMAHTIAVITVQAGVAADVLDESPGAARAALEAIRAASREAYDELRATIGLLRDADRTSAPRDPVPGLDQLTGLVDTANGAGVQVELAIRGQARPLPAAVDLTAYRIVQESLTNVVRHAQATRATVAISYEPGAVRIAVDDDGRGADRVTANGHGLTGMRERAEGVGGGHGLTGMRERAEAVGGGHGLTGMRERAEAVGGWLEAGPGPDRGFRVRACLPTERARP